MNIYEFAMGTSMFTQTLWWMAIPATIIFIISMGILFFGGDTDLDTDVDLDMDDGPSFTIFSWANMITFIMMFAWVTLLLIKNGYGDLTSIIWGIVSGIGMVACTILMHVMMMKLETKNTPTIQTVVGKFGTVLNGITAAGEVGNIQIIHNGGLKTYDCTAENMIKNGTKVKVIEVINNLLVVEAK